MLTNSTLQDNTLLLWWVPGAKRGTGSFNKYFLENGIMSALGFQQWTRPSTYTFKDIRIVDELNDHCYSSSMSGTPERGRWPSRRCPPLFPSGGLCVLVPWAPCACLLCPLGCKNLGGRPVFCFCGSEKHLSVIIQGISGTNCWPTIWADLYTGGDLL